MKQLPAGSSVSMEIYTPAKPAVMIPKDDASLEHTSKFAFDGIHSWKTGEWQFILTILILTQKIFLIYL